MKKQFSYDLTCNKIYKDELTTKLKDLKIPYFLELRDDLLYDINFDCDSDNLLESNNNYIGSLFDNEAKQYKSLSSCYLDSLLVSIENSHYYDNVEFQYRIVCDEIGIIDIVDGLNYLVPEELEVVKSDGIYSISYKSERLDYFPESTDHLQIEIMNMNTYRCLRKFSNERVEELLSTKSAA
jgi:hypothetical protein